MLILIISAGVTIFLLLAALILLVGDRDQVEARLIEISAASPGTAPTPLMNAVPSTGLGRAAMQVTNVLQPIRGLVSASDSDLEFKLTLAGFRKPEHMEVFTALKMLLPIVGIIAGSFFASNMITAILVGAIGGFFAPDLVLSYLITRRQDSIRNALPDALDLLVICMEAGLGIDQAMVRVSEEMVLTAPSLAEEFKIVSREQRAGKPRLDAWRSMAERVDIDFIRQFVAMLVQTERFGTPIAHALGSFADNLRTRRTQAAEEVAAKTGVKMLFPLLLFLFAVGVVAVGPALIGIRKMFEDFAK
jgi:tight adherence protein C